MKTKLISALFMLFCIAINAQEVDKRPKNEIKLNALYLLLAVPEIGYERQINEESSFGLDVSFSIDHSDMDFRFSATSYYRFYFGEKPTAGFFAEGFGMYNVVESSEFDYLLCGTCGPNIVPKNESDFALGVGIGGKFITKKYLTFEIYGGIGRNLFNDMVDEIVPRFGVSFGKRF